MELMILTIELHGTKYNEHNSYHFVLLLIQSNHLFRKAVSLPLLTVLAESSHTSGCNVIKHRSNAPSFDSPTHESPPSLSIFVKPGRRGSVPGERRGRRNRAKKPKELFSPSFPPPGSRGDEGPTSTRPTCSRPVNPGLRR